MVGYVTRVDLGGHNGGMGQFPVPVPVYTRDDLIQSDWSFEGSHISLQHLDMSNQKKNGLTGTIPEDLWKTMFFITLNLAGNSLTGTIPSLVGDLNVMKEFDLSNNRLVGAIPSEVGMLARVSVFCCFIALT